MIGKGYGQVLGGGMVKSGFFVFLFFCLFDSYLTIKKKHGH